MENDGLLEAREIMNMKLNADLAVLSACETANGRISPGEGVMGHVMGLLRRGYSLNVSKPMEGQFGQHVRPHGELLSLAGDEPKSLQPQ